MATVSSSIRLWFDLTIFSLSRKEKENEQVVEDLISLLLNRICLPPPKIYFNHCSLPRPYTYKSHWQVHDLYAGTARIFENHVNIIESKDFLDHVHWPHPVSINNLGCLVLFSSGGHLTFQCRNFVRVDPKKDVVVDVSSTSSEDESDKEISVSSTSTPSSSDSDTKSRAKKSKTQKRKPEKERRRSSR